MKYLIWLLLSALGFGMQGSVSLFQITPNLTAAVVCAFGVREGEWKGFFFGCLIGLVEDNVSGTFIGPHLLSKSLVGYGVASFARRCFFWTPLLGVLASTLFTFADSSMVYAARSIFSATPCGPGPAAFVIALQSLFNAPLGLLFKKTSTQPKTTRG